jgi:uncharacterized protein YqfB (UPF0267 family)
MTNDLFTEKYLPHNIREYTGFNHQSILQYIENVLNDKEKKSGMILHGLPGSGKTTLAILLPDHFGISFSYSNASDQRKKSQINSDIFRTTTLQSEKSLIILDEVDGLSKTAFKELEKVLKRYKQPTILIANDLQKIPYSIRKICHIEKFTVDRFALMALATKVSQAENLNLTRDDIKKIVDQSKSYRDVLYTIQFGSYRDVLYTIQFGKVDIGIPEVLSPDEQVLYALQNKSTQLFGDFSDLIIRFNDNAKSPNLISMADLWQRRYIGGYTFGKEIVKSILGSIRNPTIKKIGYPRTYKLIYESKNGKKMQVDPSGKKKSKPKIRILGFK